MISRNELYTIYDVPGKKVIEVLGYVKGSTVQTKHIGRDFMAWLRSSVGGTLIGYTVMMNDARKVATQRLIDDAEALGANGVVGLRLQTSGIMGGAAEIIAYGTAVKFE